MLRLQVQQLCHNNTAGVVVNRAVDANNALFQKSGIDVVSAFASAGCLYHIRDVIEVALALLPDLLRVEGTETCICHHCKTIQR